ncbi:MAG: CpsD/CapB family tyrosine-protein kinase [Eubacteriales bacterium]|nr:CpsD/CapB family tyrosine-protein kinase [Eubacteriales bacterium]
MTVNNVIEQYGKAGSALHDAVKTLRTNIRFSGMDQDIRTIVITSVMPHDGKTTLSIFLGVAMAESGQRTLLVECDCRRPMLQNYLKLRSTGGLVELLSKRAGVAEAVTHTGVERLDLLSSMVLANPVEILGSNRFQSVVEELKGYYDVIIFDTPPLGSFIEAAILASRADGTVLVMQPGSTDVTAAQNAVAQLEKGKAHVLGAVLNNVAMTPDAYYYADYYYRGGAKHKKAPAHAAKKPKALRQPPPVRHGAGSAAR